MDSGHDVSSRTATVVSRSTHMFMLLCLGFCVAFLSWAYFGELDIVSMADGEVVPSTKVKRVDHLEGGIIGEILVREGDVVKPDQPLVILEETLLGSDVREIQVRINSLSADVARLTAAAEGLDRPQYPQWLVENRPELVQQAQELFEASRQVLESELTEQREDIQQRRQEIERIEARLHSNRETLELLQKELAISADLLRDQLTTELKHIQLQREESKLRGAIEEDLAALRKARSALAEGREKLQRITHKYREEARERLKRAQRELEEFKQRLGKYSDSLQRTVIRSPVEGVVKAMDVVNVGEVVQPGETIMLIVPSEDRLVVEAHLPIADIGYVQPGQRAVVKLASRDAGRYGSLEGTVKTISPDTFTAQDGRTYYNVRVETEKNYFEKQDARYRLYPGMLVLAYIHTGKRTVLEYLLTPFLDSLTMALHER
jgi:adhesin transport system membrane fusion protein